MPLTPVLRALLFFMVLASSEWVAVRAEAASPQQLRQTEEALAHLRGFPASQSALSPKSSCSLEEQSEDEMSIDFSEEACSSVSASSSPMRVAYRVSSKLKSLPGPVGAYLSRLLADYEQILHLESYQGERVGEGNFGLAEHLVGKVRSDPELRQSALEFYSEINKREEQSPLKRRPTIQDSVSDHETGWVWKLALKYSQNDPLKAMRIIGLCGHDDVYQLIDESLDGLPYTEQEKKTEYEAQLKDIKHWIEYLSTEKKKLERGRLSDPAEKERLFQIKEDLSNYRNQLKRLTSGGPKSITMKHRFACPLNDSRFFMPGSLGVDISEAMKSRIARDQNQNVAAKYYHVYGAALVACELVRKGHSPALVAGLQKLLGWAYRAQRFNTEVCALAQKSEEDRKLEGMGESEQLEVDAAVLMRRWAFSLDGSIAGKKVFFPFQTNFRVVVPRWLEDAPVLGRLLSKVARPPGWSDERFEKARAKFESYMTDWQWTTEAHEVGGAFGAKACAPE